MSLDALTLGGLKELLSLCGITNLSLASTPTTTTIANNRAEHPYKIGAVYLIRTVTMIDVGRLVEVTAQELVLEDAAWIADTGRFADALRACEFGEVEPFLDGRVIVGRGALIDATEIAHVVRTQK